MKPIMDIEHFKIRLKNRGLKATSQRIAVHQAMMQLGHASADQVHDWIRENIEEDVTVASLYNILSQLSECGMYGRRMSSNNKMYFDVTPEPHLHLYDSVNNTYRDIPDDEVQRILTEHFKHKRFRGYKIDGIDIQFICHPSGKSSN